MVLYSLNIEVVLTNLLSILHVLGYTGFVEILGH